jgi:beta-glucanase (GH16 family)
MKIRCILSAAAFVFMSAFSLHAGAWELVWADSFNTYTGLPDPAKWAYETGASGWGNNELENYTANRLENARVDSGHLIIEARNDNYQNHQYSSVRMHSTNQGNWTYGRFEVRAILPFGKGTWPAIWMMPTGGSYGGWPSSGEIDIMEHVGSDQGGIHFSTHCLKYYFRLGNQKTATKRVADCSTAFHTYAMEWNADTIRGYVDTSLYFTNVNEHSGWQAWPFDKPFHFIFNIAIGGGWGGPVDNAIFPQRMTIDFAKVYRWNATASVDRGSEGDSRAQTKTGFEVLQFAKNLRVSLPSTRQYTATLCAIDGRIVATQHGSASTCVFNPGALTPGMYLVKIAGAWGEFSKRIVWRN